MKYVSVFTYILLMLVVSISSALANSDTQSWFCHSPNQPQVRVFELVTSGADGRVKFGSDVTPVEYETKGLLRRWEWQDGSGGTTYEIVLYPDSSAKYQVKENNSKTVADNEQEITSEFSFNCLPSKRETASVIPRTQEPINKDARTREQWQRLMFDMTQDEVIAILGIPQSKLPMPPKKEIWFYPGNNSVTFAMKTRGPKLRAKGSLHAQSNKKKVESRLELWEFRGI